MKTAKRPRRKRELLNLKLSMRTIAPKLEKGKKQEPNKVPKVQLTESLGPQISFGEYLEQQRKAREDDRRVADYAPASVPPEVTEFVPEAKYYRRLTEIEQTLDTLCESKLQDLEELVAQPPPRIRTMLLLHIYNVHYNQSNTFSLSDPHINNPSWTLRIQGKVLYPHIEAFEDLDEQKPYAKMMHFIRKMKIAFNKDQVACPPIEWDKSFSATGVEGDGFEITREGDKELDLTISIWVDYSPKQFKVTRELFPIIGIRQCTKVQAMTAFWEYVKAHRLQDPLNHKIIRCNKELRGLIGKDSIEFTEILGKMKEWLEEPDPYKIAYKLNLRKECHANEKLFKIPVELEEPNHLYLLENLSSRDNKRVTKSKAKIEKHDKKIKEYINSIKYSLYKLNFLQSYTENPANFIKSFISQQEGIRGLVQKEGTEKHNMKATKYECAEFYQHNKDAVTEAVQRYMLEEEKKRKKSDDSDRFTKRRRGRGRRRKKVDSENVSGNSENEEQKNPSESESEQKAKSEQSPSRSEAEDSPSQKKDEEEDDNSSKKSELSNRWDSRKNSDNKNEESSSNSEDSNQEEALSEKDSKSNKDNSEEEEKGEDPVKEIKAEASPEDDT